MNLTPRMREGSVFAQARAELLKCVVGIDRNGVVVGVARFPSLSCLSSRLGRRQALRHMIRAPQHGFEYQAP